MLMHPGDPELLMLSLPVFCQSARTHRKSERKKKAAGDSGLPGWFGGPKPFPESAEPPVRRGEVGFDSCERRCCSSRVWGGGLRVKFQWNHLEISRAFFSLDLLGLSFGDVTQAHVLASFCFKL